MVHVRLHHSLYSALMLCAPLAVADKLPLFGPDHIGVLFVVVGLTIAFSIGLRRTGGATRLRAVFLCTFLVLIAAAKIGAQIWLAAIGEWTLTDTLPLHLCDLAAFATIAALIGELAGDSRNWRRIGQFGYEMAYFWALGGTTQALLTPETAARFPSPDFIIFFTSHGAVVVAVLVLTLGLRRRPERGAIVRVWVATHVLAALVGIANTVTGANYMYLCGPPKRASLYDYFGPWPWSLLALEAVLIVAFLLLYSPFWLMDRSHRRAAADPNSPVH